MAPRRKEKRSERSKLDATPPWEVRVRPDVAETTGPFDVRDAPDDDVQRLDLGALRVPIAPGVDVRLETDEQQHVIGVTLAGPDGHMQVGVFAAPRNEGIWDEVRAEIAASVDAQKGGARERADGPFGPELHGTLPSEGSRVPVRFLGVDGPRWFLRAMLVGNVAKEPVKAKRFEDAFRNVVVVRGNDPLPVREPVPLQLPKEVQAASEEAEAADPD
ncbi:MAG TPA: DUF3710 domain-containing protein [Jatrophihabitantaceae bacterium]|nr:DUF3710 domain-containing protein [Jatrophihabitantaceae bacterium]